MIKKALFLWQNEFNKTGLHQKYGETATILYTDVWIRDVAADTVHTD